jgi:Co/Zn/Cd efflux system component
MPGQCCDHCDNGKDLKQGRYRTVLWAALVINLAMFALEIGAGMRGHSASLLADSLDFLGDAANYGMSLFVLSMSLTARARASQLKAATMFGFGAGVVVLAVWRFFFGHTPSEITMGVVGACALVANGTVAALLLAFRTGDSNMRSVWLCTRNDVLGNIAVLLAAFGVFGTGKAWPDLVVALAMGTLALSSAVQILHQANAEIKSRGEVEMARRRALDSRLYQVRER